jgi:hypothetical protein
MWGATRTLDKRKGPVRTPSLTEVTGRAEPFPTTMEDGREGWGERWKTEYLRSGWCGRRHRSQPPSQRLRWVGPASLWRRSWRETACPTHWSRAPTRVGPEALGGEGAPVEAREVPRAPPEVERQRKPPEGWRGEGPRCPRMARATSRWCQSTGCRRMAIRSHSVNGLGRRVHSCDHDRDPPGASRLPKSSRRRETGVR